mgnify:CR=1 FL=1
MLTTINSFPLCLFPFKHWLPLCLAVGAVFVAVDLVGKVGEGIDGGPCTLGFEAEVVVSLAHTDVTHFSPEFTPGVTHDPVLAFVGVVAPANNGDDVVHFGVGVLDDTRGVVEDGLCRDAASDGATCEDLFGHVVGARNAVVLGDGGIRVGAQTDALLSGRWSGEDNEEIEGTQTQQMLRIEK